MDAQPDDQPLAQDDDAARTLRDDATVQGVLDAVSARHAGADVDAVVVALNEGLAAAGLPEQPAPWIRSSALEISRRRVVVADGRAELDQPDGPRGAPPDTLPDAGQDDAQA